MNQENVLEFNRVTKRYDNVCLNLSLQVPRGYITGFVGANGAGKTTTLRLALGLAHPDSREVTKLDHNQVGVVFDTPHYPDNLRLGQLSGQVANFYTNWD
ncbi:hypothetical protein BK816_08400 [Boudabousia tangfeifanii]|uniref:ABC transporter domain-containing protein n=2 Tax=Boudabousia tangfeifanii TaxID=1912795 RepID=A0A1D9MLX0_9ACTO|nr:hypothetical protein BK816_08400 [Boudabousia tangfeifanii]